MLRLARASVLVKPLVVKRSFITTSATLFTATALASSGIRPRSTRCDAAVIIPIEKNATRSVSRPFSVLSLCYRGVLRLFRTIQLFLIFSPSLLLSPLLIFEGRTRHLWRLSFSWSLNFAGPAFQKLAQWASTRPDLFGAETREDLEHFHSDIPREPWYKTELTLREAGLLDAFTDFNTKPVGCGCIAQVHRAKLHGTEVAVKIRRHEVKRRIIRDLDLLDTVAWTIDKLFPFAKVFAIEETANNFSTFMRSQLDLREEGGNLEEFARIFKGSTEITFPVPLLSKETVLVETFEHGVLLSKLLTLDKEQRLPETLRKKMASAGVRSFLEMVIVNNFTHSDLHPGNIMVRTNPPFDFKHPEKEVEFDKLVYIDAGLVTKLAPNDQINFVDLFYAVAEGDGERAANLMVDRSRDPSSCVDRPGFVKGVSGIINQVAFDSFRLDRVRIGSVLETMLSLVHYHQVKLDPSFTSLVISIIVLEGVGRQLDGELDIFATSLPIIIRAQKIYRNAAIGAVVDHVKRRTSSRA